MLVSGYDILKHAQENKYAVGAFNCNNMEIIQAIVDAAEETQSPVIIQASQGGLSYAGIEYIAGMAKVAAENASVPVAIHLDHGTDFGQIVSCIRNGFSSVMIDGSQYEFEENIRVTKDAARIAHAAGVSVEAELGKIGGVEDDISVDEKDATMTDPKEAAEFVERTECDSLAIAVGTAHGVYKGEPDIDHQRISDIAAEVDVPLVLHGASGVSDEDIKEAISRGICKINIDTDLRREFTGAVHEFVKNNPDEIDPRKILGPAREAMKEKIIEKMELFGSAGQAWK